MVGRVFVGVVVFAAGGGAVGFSQDTSVGAVFRAFLLGKARQYWRGWFYGRGTLVQHGSICLTHQMVRFPMVIRTKGDYIGQLGRTFAFIERAGVVHLQHMKLIDRATRPLASILIPLQCRQFQRRVSLQLVG